MIYAKAILCGKWELPFYIPLKTELDVDKNKRSYLHYVAAEQPMVAAKCLATEWLYSGLPKGVDSVREYFGGIGITSTILRGLHPGIRRHSIGEYDPVCVVQLRALLEPLGSLVFEEDSRKSLLVPDTSDVKILDFPSSSIIHLKRKWKAGLDEVFRTKPKAVIWTDTAASYFGVHRERYGQELRRNLSSMTDYTHAMSIWLHDTYGYNITRAAHRGKNATYFLARPVEREMDEKFWPIAECLHGFVITKE